MRAKRLAGTVVFAGAVIVAGGCSDGEVEVAGADSGRSLYATHCSVCHGERGLGDGPMAAGLPVAPPSLLEHLGHHAEDQLVRIIRSGVPPAMPPAPLTDDQIRQVIEHAWTLVPDSMVAGLREMQRMAETGMGMGTGMEMSPDSGPGMPGMDETHSGHVMPGDSVRR